MRPRRGAEILTPTPTPNPGQVRVRPQRGAEICVSISRAAQLRVSSDGGCFVSLANTAPSSDEARSEISRSDEAGSDEARSDEIGLRFSGREVATSLPNPTPSPTPTLTPTPKQGDEREFLIVPPERVHIPPEVVGKPAETLQIMLQDHKFDHALAMKARRPRSPPRTHRMLQDSDLGHIDRP